MTPNESPAALLPCPLCGRPVHIKSKDGLSSILCEAPSSCIGSGLGFMFIDEQRDTAIEAWNRRAFTAPAASESVWRCTQCGELLDETNPAWRWTGSVWHHHHEHVGHVDAQRFGASESRGSVPEGWRLEQSDDGRTIWVCGRGHRIGVDFGDPLWMLFRALAAAPTPPAVSNGESPDWAIVKAVNDENVLSRVHQWAVYNAAEKIARSAAAKGEGQEKPR